MEITLRVSALLSRLFLSCLSGSLRPYDLTSIVQMPEWTHNLRRYFSIAGTRHGWPDWRRIGVQQYCPLYF